MKRKMVSFILCIAMCMALAIPAFAVELSPYATDEVGNFSQMIEFAFSDNVEGRFRYSYNDAAGNVVNGLVIKEISTDGTTKMNFVEGDKSDKVEIDSIRDVILNGMAIHRSRKGKRNTMLGERIVLYYKAVTRKALRNEEGEGWQRAS